MSIVNYMSARLRLQHLTVIIVDVENKTLHDRLYSYQPSHKVIFKLDDTQRRAVSLQQPSFLFHTTLR